MNYILNKHGIAFVVTVEIDLSKIDGQVFDTLYDMNVNMEEDCIGYEYLITREDENSPIMMFTDFSGEIVQIDVEQYINEFVL